MKKLLMVGLLLVTGVSFAGSGGGRIDPGSVTINGSGGGRIDPGSVSVSSVRAP